MLGYLFSSFLADAVTIPSPPALPSYEGVFVKMLLSLGLLIVGAIGTVWFLRRLSSGRFGKGRDRYIQLIDTRALSQKTVLYLVEIEGKRTLIAESQVEVRSLGTTEVSE